MSRFYTEKPLRSVHIDIDLLSKLEAFILETIPELIPGRFKSKKSKQYSIELTDKYGSEQLDSFKKYKDKLLPDSISSLLIELKDAQKTFELSILFDMEEGGSVTLDFESDNVRERAISIIEGIDLILRNYSTINRIYHPWNQIGSVAGIFALLLGIVSLSDVINGKYLEASGPGFFTFALGFYYYIGKFLKTIVSFETRRYKALNKYYLWLVSSCSGFILSGIILTFFKNRFFGEFLK
ncbi:hypothetical protein EHO60_13215 [Leptospira fletcheri]|uniref:Uncharacterized protein n=1 Tax=Leptospira fletcheri TaxID=2484981 RepID=A0A4R9GBG0_9LEPT|nr:hypothetical protein [Leptospira fletcheri]TGK08981.1 hypothetical protein EHO60_13215 [Leptospira fletcheri]